METERQRETSKYQGVNFRTFHPTRIAGEKRCNLCLTEKLFMLQADQSKTLNKRTEQFSKFCHRKKFNAGRFKRYDAHKHKQNR